MPGIYLVEWYNCDIGGQPANFTLASELRANLSNSNNLKPVFQHQVTGDIILIFLDPCHMLKLVRNCFRKKEVLIDNNRNCINWEYMSKLVHKQNAEGPHAAKKLRMRDLQFLSRSVSDALLYLCQHLHDVEFVNAEATATAVYGNNK